MFISMCRMVPTSYAHILSEASSELKLNYKFRAKDYDRLKEIYDKDILPFIHDGTSQADQEVHFYVFLAFVCSDKLSCLITKLLKAKLLSDNMETLL